MPQRGKTAKASPKAPTPHIASDLEATLLFQLRAAGLPMPVQQFSFAKAVGRRWRADFAWVAIEHSLLCEVDGGTWTAGRHVTGKGYQADCEKLNYATLLGWRVLRFTGEMVRSGAALAMIEQALAVKAGAA